MREKAKQATFGFTSWGGKRKGAGRKPKGEKPLVSHRPRPRLKHYTPALVTLRLCANLPSLRDDGVLAVVKDARLKSAREDLRIVHFSIQTNHLHLLVEAQDNAVLARGMKSFTVRLAKLLKREWRHKGRVFGDRYHLQVLGTPQQVRNALVYTLNNARKHNSWKPKRPDPYSSGIEFEHWLEPRAEWDKDLCVQSSSPPPKRPKRRAWMWSMEWVVHALPAAVQASEQGRKVREKHAAFHREAARVLELALGGKKDQASAALALASAFTRLCAELTQLLTDGEKQVAA